MPTFVVKVGGDIYDVDAPDEATARAKALPWIADQYVANERKDGGIGQGVTDTVRNLARGTPVGSWLDEANAATAAGLHTATGGKMGAPYDEAKAYQDATDRAVDKDTGWTGTGTKIVGGVASALVSPMLAPFGAVAAPVAGVVAKAPALLPQVANGALNGIGYGTVYGAGEGNSLSERAGNAFTGGVVGGGIGAAAPIVARAAGNGYDAFREWRKGVPADLKPYSKGSVTRAAGALADDRVTPATIAADKARLGPERMIIDSGENSRLHGATLGERPGASRTIMADALDRRKEGAIPRIKAGINEALGPEQNIVALEAATKKKYSDLARPLYDKFRDTKIPQTMELENTLSILQDPYLGPRVINEARLLAGFGGKVAGQPNKPAFFASIADDGSTAVFNRAPNATEWDLLKRAVDDLAKKDTPGSNLQSLYRDLSKQIRGAVDNALSPGNPNGSIYKQARDIAGEGIGFKKALEAGSEAFTRKMTPDRMSAEMAGMSQLEQEAYKIGARGVLRDSVGNAATSFRPNGDVVARKTLGSEYAQDKLKLLAGEDKGAKLSNLLNAESTFEVSRQGVREGAKTARMKAAQDLYPDVSAAAPVGPAPTAWGDLVSKPIKWSYNKLVSGAKNESADVLNADAARIFTAKGDEAEKLATALLGYSSARASLPAEKKAIEALAKALMAGERPDAIQRGQKYIDGRN